MLASASDEDLLARLLGRRVTAACSLAHLLQLGPTELSHQGLSAAEADLIVVAAEIARRHQPGDISKWIRRPEDVVATLRDVRHAPRSLMVVFSLDRTGAITARNAFAATDAGCAQPDVIGVAQWGLRAGGSALIVAHTHFASEAPTRQDMDFTAALANACRREGIDLADHVIVARRSWLSLRRNGIIY
jgi:DNA repair protein RadC